MVLRLGAVSLPTLVAISQSHVRKVLAFCHGGEIKRKEGEPLENSQNGSIKAAAFGWKAYQDLIAKSETEYVREMSKRAACALAKQRGEESDEEEEDEESDEEDMDKEDMDKNADEDKDADKDVVMNATTAPPKTPAQTRIVGRNPMVFPLFSCCLLQATSPSLYLSCVSGVSHASSYCVSGVTPGVMRRGRLPFPWRFTKP